jgi:ribosomal protein L22
MSPTRPGNPEEGKPADAEPTEVAAEEAKPAAASEAATGEAATEEAAEEKPAPKPRRRRKATPKAEATAEADAGEAGADEAAADDPAAAKADADEAAADEAAAANAAADKPAADKPAKPARRERSERSEPSRRRRPPGERVTVRAHAKYVRTSARKARLVCDHIRGKSVEEARAILAHTPRAVARDWSKLLESAVANAEHNHELIGDELRIDSVTADEGPTLKRFRPRAYGRATRIRKRTSHLTITLTPKE